ncbi:MAG TPA: TraB/GumN family protein [Rhizomicrobium sp.]|nr:TraB/GumN family protein [Rhizomicrobium sp.]
MKKTLRSAALFALALLAGVSAAFAQAQPALPPFMAYPSLWHIKTDQGEVYMLGAVHVLPANVRWRTPQISHALARSDVFVFEVPEDAKSMQELAGMIQARGYLPPDQSLRAEISPAALPDYDAAVAASGLPATGVDRERPWLAGIQLMFAQMRKLNYATSNGVDSTLMEEAAKNHRQMRYFETIAEQFALLAPDDPKLELQEFESGLKDLRDLAGDVQPMMKAWGEGNQAKLDELINGDLNEFPEARKTLLDDRNKRWAPKIEAMLKEKHVFFICVGAGHLTGAAGVPALLRADGYKVDGP